MEDQPEKIFGCVTHARWIWREIHEYTRTLNTGMKIRDLVWHQYILLGRDEDPLDQYESIPARRHCYTWSFSDAKFPLRMKHHLIKYFADLIVTDRLRQPCGQRLRASAPWSIGATRVASRPDSSQISIMLQSGWWRYPVWFHARFHASDSGVGPRYIWTQDHSRLLVFIVTA